MDNRMRQSLDEYITGHWGEDMFDDDDDDYPFCCVFCNQGVPVDQHRTHWEVCPEHPARKKLDAQDAALRAAHREMLAQGNRDNWTTIPQAYVDAMNAIANRYGTGVLDEHP